MNFQTAGIAGGAAFLLSFLAGVLGGVPFFDILVRASIWAAVGFGGSLGVEALLKSLIPDLFVAPETDGPEAVEPAAERTVDITLEEDGSYAAGGVIEEVDTDAPAPVRPRIVVPAAAPPPEAAAAAEPEAAEDTEEMPEIGSFLDAFKPNAPEEGEGAEAPAPVPEYGEYAPVEPDRPSRSSRSADVEGADQDPAILAKAVQTVMKRDGQGT